MVEMVIEGSETKVKYTSEDFKNIGLDQLKSLAQSIKLLIKPDAYVPGKGISLEENELENLIPYDAAQALDTLKRLSVGRGIGMTPQSMDVGQRDKAVSSLTRVVVTSNSRLGEKDIRPKIVNLVNTFAGRSSK